MERPEVRNVGPMNSQLRAQIGTEVALIRFPVLNPTKSPKGRATSTESKRAGISRIASSAREGCLSEQPVFGGLAGGDQAAEVAEGEERPALGGHRRAQLEDAEHVVEALGTAEVPDQEYRAQDHGEEHRVAAGAGEGLVLVAEESGPSWRTGATPAPMPPIQK